MTRTEKGLSEKSGTTPTKVPVAPPMERESAASALRLSRLGGSTAGKSPLRATRPPRRPAKKASPQPAPTPAAACVWRRVANRLEVEGGRVR